MLFGLAFKLCKRLIDQIYRRPEFLHSSHFFFSQCSPYLLDIAGLRLQSLRSTLKQVFRTLVLVTRFWHSSISFSTRDVVIKMYPAMINASTGRNISERPHRQRLKSP